MRYERRKTGWQKNPLGGVSSRRNPNLDKSELKRFPTNPLRTQSSLVNFDPSWDKIFGKKYNDIIVKTLIKLCVKIAENGVRYVFSGFHQLAN